MTPYHPIIVIYAVVLHIAWAVLLLFDPSSANVTAISSLVLHLSVPMVAILLTAVGIAAAIGMFVRMRMILAVLLMLPQQFVLFISAGGALEAMWLSRFADGVVRNQAFIISDQSPAVLLALFHTWAIVKNVKTARL